MREALFLHSPTSTAIEDLVAAEAAPAVGWPQLQLGRGSVSSDQIVLVRSPERFDDPTREFTMAIPRDEVASVGLGRRAVLLSLDHEPQIVGIAWAIASAWGTTLDRVVRLTEISILEQPVPLVTLTADWTRRWQTMLTASVRSLSRATVLPEGLSRETRRAMTALLGPAIWERARPLLDRIGRGQGHENIEDQIDAVSTALRCSGMNLDLLDAAKPTTHPRSVLATLQPIAESHLIQHDAEQTWPHLEVLRSAALHEYVFRDGGNTLHVMNVNALPLESAAGVDLLYFNERYGSFVGVQYKRAAVGQDRQILCPVDDRLVSQLERMNEFDALSAVAVDGASYRSLQATTFVKFARTVSRATRTFGLVDGPYVPAAYLRHLFTEGKLVGPRGGKSVTYENLGRWMPKTVFAHMVQYGWAGSTGLSEEVLQAWIESSIQANRSVIAASFQPYKGGTSVVRRRMTRPIR